MQKSFSQVYARIWHSHKASLRAFQKAGWTRVAIVIEINPLRRQTPIRLRFGSIWPFNLFIKENWICAG